MNEITYHREGDYLVPNLLPPESQHIGIWGIRRLNFLKQHHNGIYTGLLLSGKLIAHLEEIDCAANKMFELLMQQFMACEGITEELKSRDQMEWVRRMNCCRKTVEEIIREELIFE